MQPLLKTFQDLARRSETWNGLVKKRNRQMEYETLTMDGCENYSHEKVCLEHLQCAKRRAFFNDITGCIGDSCTDPEDVTWLKDINPQATAFMRDLFECETSKRSDAPKALRHPWFTGKSSPEGTARTIALNKSKFDIIYRVPSSLRTTTDS